MNWKSFFLGAAVGIIGGIAAKEYISHKTRISPERVLENAKQQFKKSGTISGSWIHMVAEPFEQNQMTYQVYKGGISKLNNGKSEQFEFIADAMTGTILDVQQINGQLVS